MASQTPIADKANTILTHMSDILNGLASIQTLLKANDMTAVAATSQRVVDLQKKIKDMAVDLDTIMENMQSFAHQYYPLKANILTLIDENTAAIKEWKYINSNKVTNSTEKIDQIIKYFNNAKTSYFIDKQE